MMAIGVVAAAGAMLKAAIRMRRIVAHSAHC
jgi:hypothetical protein